MVFLGPNAMAVIFANHNNQWHVVEATEMSETPCSVARTCADEACATVIVQALNGWNGFHIFEAASGTHSAFFGPVAVESDPKVAHAQCIAEGIRLVGRGPCHILV